MTGWDTPSRPTWDPQDGPEDSTQAFPASDNSGGDDRWPQPAGSGWDGPDSAEAEFLPREFEPRKPGATLAGRGGYGAGPQVSARDEPPWPGPARQESARPESARPEYGRTGEYGGPDLGRADLDRLNGASQDFPRRDPGRADYSAAYPTYSGQPDQAEQAPPAANLGDADLAARMDPALQDFFAPTKPDPRYGSARPGPADPGLPGPGLPGPGLPGPGLPGPGLPSPGLPGPGQSSPGLPGPAWSDSGRPPLRGDGRGPQRPARPADPWQDPDSYPSQGPQDGPRRPGPRDDRPGSHGDRPGLRDDRPGSRDDRRIDSDEILPASRGKRILAIGAVVVIVAAGGAYLALHKSTPSNNAAANGPTPTASTVASTPASTATATPKGKNSTKKSGVTGSANSSGGYVLSTPATAGGYPIGTDPHFLSITTATAATLEQSAVNGGGGTIAGKPVSASYTLPDEQTIEFVGYQGTFSPSKVMSNLGSFGSSENIYPAGNNGGQLACANTTATATTPSGAVCFWVTKSTLGFAEFFTQANGPEPLNTAQAKGAQDTINLRSSVETLKSS